MSTLSLSPTVIEVTWEEVPLIDRNGEIILYEVLYESRDEIIYPNTSQTVNTTELLITLTDLFPFTTYSISVRAYTSVDHGPYSDIIYSTTLEAGIANDVFISECDIMMCLSIPAPSTPTNVAVVEIGSTYVIISWEAPLFPNGLIRGYTVEVLGSDDEVVSNVFTADLLAIVTNLSPFTHYRGVVSAETVEVGEPSLNISFITSEDSKLIFTSITIHLLMENVY